MRDIIIDILASIAVGLVMGCFVGYITRDRNSTAIVIVICTYIALGREKKKEYE